jgi:hypothetical protein
MTENRIFTPSRMITWVVFLRMFWNFISSWPVKRGGSLSFLVGTISNVLVMEIGWTDVGSGGYILVSCAHSNTSWYSKCKSSYTVYYLYFTLLFVLIRQGWTLRFLPTCPFELVVWCFSFQKTGNICPFFFTCKIR